MKSHTFCSRPHFFKMRLPSFLLLLIALSGNPISAQTTLISAAGAGGFQNGPTFSDNGWTVVNLADSLKWHIGNTATGFANPSAFISNDGGTTHAYYNTRSGVVHFYRDVTFPAGQSNVTLSFQWKGSGETNLDELVVSLSPTSFTPTSTTTSLGNALLRPSETIVRLSGSSTVQNYSVTVSPDLISNCTSAQTRRLIFTWKNNNTGGTNPPAAIDNISLVSMAPPAPAIMLSETSGYTDNDGNLCPAATATLTATGGGTYLWSPGGSTSAGITVVPPVGVSTTYTVTVTNSGCPQTVSRTLTVDPVPTPLYNVNFQKCINDAPFDVKTAIEGITGHTLGVGVMFTGTGITGNMFDPGAVPAAGVYNINVNYACPDPFGTNDFFSIEVFADPISDIVDKFVSCMSPGPGSYYLQGMFKDANTVAGGTFEVLSGPGVVNIDGINLDYTAPGCFQIRYRAPNPAPGAPTCETTPQWSTANLLITEYPTPSFTIAGEPGGCTTTPTTLTINRTSPAYVTPGVQYLWEVTSIPANAFTLTNATSAVPNIVINTPVPGQVITLEIKLTETFPLQANCGGVVDATSCTNTSAVQTVTVYQDMFNCASNCPEIESDICASITNPFLILNCNLFNLGLPVKILDAKINTPASFLSCTDDHIDVNWQAGFFGLNINTGPTLGSLPGLSQVCDVITYRFCIRNPLPIGPTNIACIKPFFFLPNSITSACNKTITQVLLDGIGQLAGGKEGGVEFWADTDGDGSFDMRLVNQRLDVSQSGSVSIPNNVQGQGTISARLLASWPNRASSICGVVQPSINLLDLIPIGAIPLIGPPVKNLLQSGGCGINIAFSDEETVRWPVTNDQAPVFLNCPDSGYVFANEFTCSTPANWSVPVAADACSSGILPFISGNSTGPGVRQTGGPMPGSFFPLGPADTVRYVATACNNISTECKFTVKILPGNPRLVCPRDVTVSTDADRCDAVITGLTPLEGIGCNTTITYVTSGATAPVLAGMTDVSGGQFDQGVTTVTYTMAYDSLGVPLTRTCSFNVTVLDVQKPQARCKGIDVQLDNTGSVTVTAAQIDGGSSDNCGIQSLAILGNTMVNFGPSVSFDCSNIGGNTVTLQVKDVDGNVRNCLAMVNITDFFEGFKLGLDVPELCLENPNPTQLNFSNYLSITKPDGVPVPPALVGTLGPDVVGGWGITAFVPAYSGAGAELGTSPSDPRDVGYIDPLTGVYTPGSSTGFLTISYILAIGQQIAQDSAQITGCYEIVHDVFELRQPLTMDAPECECVQENERIVDLGIVKGGLEPYTIQYSGGRLDTDGDNAADDNDGEYTFSADNGYNINDFQQDLGELRIVYTQPVWSFKIVDARGCELFRSGSCDNNDLLIRPQVICPPSVNTLTTEEYVCQSNYTWTHPVPTDNCAVTLFDYRITNPNGTVSGPNNLNALLYPPPPGNPPYPPSFFQANYNFGLGVSTITYYAEDAQGNFGTCSFNITVSDNDPPHFINCPAPPVIQDAESMHCDAYVTFALPLATDNCDFAPVITKIDNTGLNTGSRFPVGTTILYWDVRDFSGNRDTCQIKVIVNDYWQDPILACPAAVVKNNDPWLCGAVVNNIAPAVDGPCKNNYGITYTIYGDAALTQVKDCGVTNASGEFFDKGDSWVKYTVSNQPLLLITEVAQSGVTDRLEISNLGPADIDISCLEIKRVATNPAANETLGPVTLLPSLAPSILPVGATRVFDFAFNGAANMPACYTISYMGTVFDQVATNAFAGCNGFTGALATGDVIRKCEDDTNTAADWVPAENCYPLTLGAINPDLEVMPNNGTKTSLQSILPNKVSCVFKVTVRDAESPFCGRLTSTTTYNGAAIPNISPATCNRSTITIPAGNCIIGDIVFNRTGTATPQNSTMTLISPKGIKVVITEIPDDSLATLFGQKAEGVWTLDVVPNAGQTPTVTGWSLTVNCIAPFDLANQVLPNDAGQCGAAFTWTHPYFVDNCFQGTISVAYTSDNAACVPQGGPLLGTLVKGGYSNTQFFCVGTTLVTYTLTDAAGNTSTCGFSVTVNDVEKPVLTCPQPIIVHLNGGECGAFVSYAPAFAGDNCGVVNTVLTPPSGSWFEIGNHQVTIVIYDAAGNSQTCTFPVSIIEYVPTDFNLVCNDLSHVSMDATCTFVLNADGALEGSNYHCYDDYVITVKNQQNQPVGNLFGAADIGKTFTVTVLDPETGNSCWTILKIEDKLAPTLTCPADVTVACSESTDLPNTGDVLVKDCSATTKVIDDEFLDFGQCDSPRGQIVRTWIVTDAWSNQTACSQTITITPFDLQDLVFPQDITLDCESAYLNNLATAPDATGRPSINGFPIGTGGLCTASITFVDERYEICPGSYEILRTWKVRNTCFPVAPDNPITHVQVITVSDSNGPHFACPPALTVSTNPSQCCASAPLPSIIVSEGCSHIVNLKAKVSGVDLLTNNVITFTVNGTLADFPGNNYWTPDTLAVFGTTQCLPRGTFTVVYSAGDQCNNLSSCSFALTVEDLVPPVATCTEFTTVAIGQDDPNDCYVPTGACQSAGVTWVPATAFNQGSHDNCNGLEFTVRRMPENDGTYSACIDGLQNMCDSLEYDIATAENDSIKFYCCEVGTTQRIILRVYQIDLEGNRMTYPDGSYIYNECMIQVEVQDKIKPVCQPPVNVTVSCENFDPSLWAYGYPTVSDNCCLDETPPVSADPQGAPDVPTGTIRIPELCGATQKVYYSGFLNANFDTTCNKGTIIRRFTAWDCVGQSSSCTQRIVVEYRQDYNITFPADISVNCVTIPDIGKPVITNDEGCELIGVSYNDVLFTVVPDACYKIERTWRVINWCTYNPDAACYDLPRNPLNAQGLAPAKSHRVWDGNNLADENCVVYKQVIMVSDLTPPTVTCSNIDTCDVSTNDVRYWNDGETWWDNGTMQHDLCEKETDLSVTVQDMCDTIAPEGGIRFRYLLFLDLDNDGVMETVVSSADATTRPVGQVLFNNYQSPNYSAGTNRVFDNNSNLSQRYRFDIEQTAGSARVIWRNATGTKLPELPHGKHKIKWIAEDGCGNEAVCEKTFTVRDCKPPVVACANVNINLMVGGMATLWANDFFLYGEDNCTPANTLNTTLAVIRADENPGNTYPGGAPAHQSVVVTCDEQGQDVPVQIWLSDAAGNTDFCVAYVNVQANAVGCTQGTQAAVAGVLATEIQQGIEQSNVQLVSSGPAGQQYVTVQQSNDLGVFVFPNAVPMNSDYTLTPLKDDNPLNGVTTYDLVLISKHILGLEPLTTPYKIIAADANRSGSITTFDIVEFRKLILGVYSELPNNTSWRFVDKSYVFPQPSNPFQAVFPENISAQDVAADRLTENFVGVKIGDVNNTMIANTLQSAEERTAATMLFDVEDRTVKNGEVFTVHFKGAERVQGYQFTMNLNGLEMMSIAPGANTDLSNFGVFPDAITTSVDGDANEFDITFRAVKAGRISAMLGVSSRITKAEAYPVPGASSWGATDRMDVAFRFNGAAGSVISGVGFELYQNQPNPFVNKTFIGFHLPEATSATLRVFDETGRVIFTQNGDFEKGYNTFAIDRQLITTAGVLYYSVETARDNATRKMIQSK